MLEDLLRRRTALPYSLRNAVTCCRVRLLYVCNHSAELRNAKSNHNVSPTQLRLVKGCSQVPRPTRACGLPWYLLRSPSTLIVTRQPTLTRTKRKSSSILSASHHCLTHMINHIEHATYQQPPTRTDHDDLSVPLRRRPILGSSEPHPSLPVLERGGLSVPASPAATTTIPWGDLWRVQRLNNLNTFTKLLLSCVLSLCSLSVCRSLCSVPVFVEFPCCAIRRFQE